MWNFDAGDARDVSPNGFDGVMMGDAACVPGQPSIPSAKATVAGVIQDTKGNPLQNASVRLEKDGIQIAETLSDANGCYQISIWPSAGGYHLFAHHDRVSAWELDLEFEAGQSQTVSLSLHPGISGRVMTKTSTPLPHVFVQALQTDPQQAATETTVRPTVVATTQTDKRGEYYFTGLQPGSYLLRCHVLDRHVYYRQSGDSHEVMALADGDVLQVGPDQINDHVDLSIPPFCKGTWHTYTERDGLIHNRVNTIYQGRDRMLWFGTDMGLSRFDGAGFTNFTAKDGLVSDKVLAIYQDDSSAMWFGTDNGLSRYEEGQFTNFTTKEGLAGNSVHAIHQDNAGVLWFGTNKGVSCYHGAALLCLERESLCTDFFAVIMIADAPKGDLWFGTSGRGLARYTRPALAEQPNASHHGGEFRDFLIREAFQSDCVRDAARAPGGDLWFSTKDRIFRFASLDPVQRCEIRFERQKDPTVYDPKIAFDSQGVLWVSTTYDGVFRIVSPEKCQTSEEVMANFTTAHGLASDQCYDIYCDTEDRVWVATGAGVSLYSPSSFIGFTIEDGLADHLVNDIHIAKDGTLLFATARGGISLYDGQGFTSLSMAHGLVSDQISAIHVDPSGRLWLGSVDGRIGCYEWPLGPAPKPLNEWNRSTSFGPRESGEGDIWDIWGHHT